MPSWIAGVVIAVVGAAAPAFAQPATRVATTTAALTASPVFFHGKPVAAFGSIQESRDLFRLEPPSRAAAAETAPASAPGPGGIYVYWRERPTRTSGEIRGEFWDLGRLTEGDSRFSAYDFRPLLEAVAQGRWPGRDQIFVIIGATLVEAEIPENASLRAIAMAPEKFADRNVTVSGRFRGRNLHADLPTPPGQPTKWDFVIQSADASVWVTGMRPRGKGFELDPDARRDTGRWLQVSGMVRTEGSRVWIEARELELSSAPDETAVEVAVPVTPAEPPPTVVFATPVPDETDVELTAPLRVQFSRDMNAASFKGRVQIAYVPAAGGAARPAAALPEPPVWTLNYNVGNRAIEVKFTKPLEPFQTVKVDLLEGITAIDGQPLAPWSLTFTTGR